MTGFIRAGWAGLALTLIALTAACTAPGQPDTSVHTADPTPAFNARAKQVAQQWSGLKPTNWTTAFMPLEDLTVFPSDPGFSKQQLRDFYNGQLTFEATEPVAPSQGNVTFADGSRLALPLESPNKAFAQLPRRLDQSCVSPLAPVPSKCLIVTRVRLGIVTLLTSRGMAQVPAWLFTFQKVSAPVAEIAIARSAISKVPSFDVSRTVEQNIGWVQHLVRISGKTVTFQAGYGSCDTDLHPLVYEDAHVIVLGDRTTPTAGSGACDAVGHRGIMSVTLQRSLGSRAILDNSTGVPLTITLGAQYPFPG